MNRFSDKVVVVTGAASGIGEAAARLFAAEGGKVVVADVNASRGEQVAAEIGGGFVHTDVTREATIDNASQSSPLGSAAMPSEIAQSLVYLASDEALHITAHALVVDSGVSVAGSSGSALFHERPVGFMGRLPE